MERVFIVDSARTAIGKFGGIFSDILPEYLGGDLLKKLLARQQLSRVDEVIVGNIIGGGGNVGRRLALASGLAVETPALTIDRQCASGLESLVVATAKIKSGMASCIACGGVESTSRSPWLIERPAKLFGGPPKIIERAALSIDAYGDPTMGEACEALADRLQISRVQQDAYAYQSQVKYQQASQSGTFKDEIIAVQQVTTDESPREDTSLKKLAALPAVFKENGTLTAGNSSPLNDGAAFVIIASESFCKTNQLQPLFEVVDGVSVGTLPEDFGLGPVYATEKLLAKQGLAISEIDRIELNEAFASQALACIQTAGWQEARVNRSGGALAFGHPFGATGAILVRRLMTELEKRPTLKTGLVTMCVGGGQGTSLLLRKVD